MNRRKVMLGLASAPLAATSMSFAQGNSGANAGVGANLITQLFDASGASIGTFAIQRFAVVNNQLNAIGAATLVHPTTNSAGSATTGTLVTTLAQQVKSATSIAQSAASAAPTANPPATCPILHLDIAPIDITILGLEIKTSEIVLDIIAIPGPGNLLGNLLCLVAGLLDPGGALTNALNQIAALLNQILAAL